jgi:hypothetical protein
MKALRPKDIDPFVTGLESLAAEFEKNPPKGNECTAAIAANWYMAEFSACVVREQAEGDFLARYLRTHHRQEHGCGNISRTRSEGDV